MNFPKTIVDLPTISAEIKAAVNDFTAIDPDAGRQRTYLGGSVIGHECKAALWFSFRWISDLEDFDGRKRRLFNRGHLEEVRINAWLRGAGWDVQEKDPSTGKQWQFSAVDGHFGGSCDKQMTHPKYEFLGRVLGEDKTHSVKNFTNLLRKGVELAMPKHVSQMHVYGAYFQNQYALYFPVNKNDDDIDPVLLEVDVNEARKLTMKAEEIISARVRPNRCSETPTYFSCLYCQHKAACHTGRTANKSCRSCKFSRPAPGGTWVCENYNMTIPDDFIPQGCELWQQVSY